MPTTLLKPRRRGSAFAGRSRQASSSARRFAKTAVGLARLKALTWTTHGRSTFVGSAASVTVNSMWIVELQGLTGSRDRTTPIKRTAQPGTPTPLKTHSQREGGRADDVPNVTAKGNGHAGRGITLQLHEPNSGILRTGTHALGVWPEPFEGRRRRRVSH